jgi:hypothetical protein
MQAEPRKCRYCGTELSKERHNNARYCGKKCKIAHDIQKAKEDKIKSDKEKEMLKLPNYNPKIKFYELIKNRNGKVSGSGFLGIFTGFTGIVMLLCGTGMGFFGVIAYNEVLLTGFGTLTLGAGLMGYRKKKEAESGLPPLPAAPQPSNEPYQPPQEEAGLP